MTITRISTKTVNIHLLDNGIAELRSKPDMLREFDLNDMRLIVEAIKSVNDSHRLLLIYIDNGKYSQEARKFLSNQNTIADKIAMVANKPLQKLVGNFFLGINRPKIPIKLFSNSLDAESWLLI